MTIYYSMIILMIIFGAIKDKKNQKKMVYFCAIMLSFISGLRHYTIGNDTLPYYKSFMLAINYGRVIFKVSSFEKGYLFFEYLVTRFTQNFNFFLLIISLFINIVIAKFIIRYSTNFMFSLILFVLMRFFFAEMNIMREFIAIAITLIGLKYIEEKKLIKYVIIIAIASSFHFSAWCMIVVYFLHDFKINKKNYTILFIIMMVCYLFLESILNFVTLKIDLYNQYISKRINSNEVASVMQLLISLSILFFVIIVMKKNKKDYNNKQDVFFINICYFTCLINLICVKISIFDRIGKYFNLFYIVIIPFFAKKIKNLKTRILVYVIIFSLFLLYFLLTTYLRPEWNLVNPYRFYWR